MQNDNLMIIHFISKIAVLNFLALLKRYKLTDEKNTKKRNQGTVLFEIVLKVVCIKNKCLSKWVRFAVKCGFFTSFLET